LKSLVNKESAKRKPLFVIREIKNPLSKKYSQLKQSKVSFPRRLKDSQLVGFCDGIPHGNAFVGEAYVRVALSLIKGSYWLRLLMRFELSLYKIDRFDHLCAGHSLFLKASCNMQFIRMFNSSLLWVDSEIFFDLLFEWLISLICKELN